MTANAIKGTTKAAATRQPIRIHTQVDTPVRARVITSVSGGTVVVIAFWVVLAVVVVATVVVTFVVVVATVVVATLVVAAVVVTGGET